MTKYSSHARERMLERSITERDVEDTLAHPFEFVQARYGRKAACRRLSSRKYLVVVFEDEGEGFIVITAVKVDKDRARRFGFTRV